MEFAKDQSGSTLLQALAAMAILTVALQNVMGGVSASDQLFRHQYKVSEAVHVGQSVMEGLLMAFDTDTDLTAGTHTAFYDATGTRLTGSGPYTVTWVVTLDTPVPGTKQLQVSLSWAEGANTRQAALTSYRN